MVTQHVIAETLNCRRGWFKDHTEDVRKSGVSLVTRFEIEEQPCRISDLAADKFYLRALIELGPADAGLLYVAQSIGATLISDDGKLLQRAHGRVPVCIPRPRG
jgi:predicted nucleic acid-binding protein